VGGRARLRILAFLGILSFRCGEARARAGGAALRSFAGRERVRDETDGPTPGRSFHAASSAFLRPALFIAAVVTATASGFKLTVQAVVSGEFE